MNNLTTGQQDCLLSAVDILRQLSRKHNDEFQRARDSANAIVLHKGRLAMEKAIQLDRMANEINMVAATDGFKDG